MDYHHCDCIVMLGKFETGELKSVMRVIETPDETGFSYSIFETTSYCGSDDESFAFDVTRRRDSAEALCMYLCKMEVSAAELNSVLSDCIGSESVPSAFLAL